MTPAQLTALRAACFADPTAAAFFVAPGNASGLRSYLNGASASNAWRTDAPVDAILDAIEWAKFTPTVTVSGAESEPMLSRKRAWIDEVNVKQMALQNLTGLGVRPTINAARPNIRGGLRDCLVQLPTGALDANQKPALTSAGGANGSAVLAACVRLGTRAEIMLAAPASASDTTPQGGGANSTTARVLTFEGEVSEQEATALMFKDNGDLWTAQG